jgi:hypothetical protein
LLSSVIVHPLIISLLSFTRTILGGYLNTPRFGGPGLSQIYREAVQTALGPQAFDSLSLILSQITLVRDSMASSLSLSITMALKRCISLS